MLLYEGYFYSDLLDVAETVELQVPINLPPS
jgi:hypothetical protein